MGARFNLGVAVVLGAVLVSPSVWADPASTADELLTKGVQLREQGRDEEALAVFKQALEKAPSARARAQVALAQQALGMWVLAEADLVAALADEDDPWIAKHRGALEGALAVIRKRLGTLEVRGAEEADVYLDGVKVGQGAGPFRVEAGTRNLEVRAAGYRTLARWVDVAPGGIARETVALVAEANPAEAGSAGASSSPNMESERKASPGSSQRLIGWTFAGAGAALLATGVAGIVVRNGIVAQYNADCPGVGEVQSPACQERIDSASTWMTVSILSLVAGGAFGVGGAALLFTAPSRAPEERTPSAAWVTCGPTSAVGVACAGTF